MQCILTKKNDVMFCGKAKTAKTRNVRMTSHLFILINSLNCYFYLKNQGLTALENIYERIPKVISRHHGNY